MRIISLTILSLIFAHSPDVFAGVITSCCVCSVTLADVSDKECKASKLCTNKKTYPCHPGMTEAQRNAACDEVCKEVDYAQGKWGACPTKLDGSDRCHKLEPQGPIGKQDDSQIDPSGEPEPESEQDEEPFLHQAY